MSKTASLSGAAARSWSRGGAFRAVRVRAPGGQRAGQEQPRRRTCRDGGEAAPGVTRVQLSRSLAKANVEGACEIERQLGEDIGENRLDARPMVRPS